MKAVGGLGLGLVLGLVLSLTLSPVSGAAEMKAYAAVINGSGERIGTASFQELASGDVRVTVNVSGLTPGEHGFHIHAVGLCDPAAFTSAGGHFNPHGAHHGLQTSAGPHAGDMPNLRAGSNGVATFDMVIARFTLSPGGASIFDADGSALIIHADRDDGITDPTGNSGGRVACGVIKTGSEPATAGSVSPPSTGDAGLLGSDTGSSAIRVGLAAILVALVAAAGLGLLRFTNKYR